MKYSQRYMKALDKNCQDVDKADVLVFLKEDIMQALEPFYHSALTEENWNNMMYKLDCAFNGFEYRGYVHNSKRLITRLNKDAIFEFTSKYFQIGFLYIHLRDNKLWVNLNVF